MRHASLFLLSFVLVLPACGGKIAGQGDGDGGPAVDGGVSQKDGGTTTGDSGVIVKDGGIVPTDGGPPPPPPPPCGPKNGSGYAGTDGSCGSTEQWECGGTQYEVDCQCPAGGCACVENGVTTSKIKYAACPSCTSMSGVAAQCGFPE